MFVVTSMHYTYKCTVFVGPQLGDIVSALKEITNPYLLGINLDVEEYQLKKIEQNYPQNIDRQMAEVISYWLRNSSDCSWGALASAVEKMGRYRNLVKTLRDRHKKALKTATKQVKHEVL